MEAELSVKGLETRREARVRTARELVHDAVHLAENFPSEDRHGLTALLNLLYDVTVTAAEYYKMFVREQLVPQRPASS